MQRGSEQVDLVHIWSRGASARLNSSILCLSLASNSPVFVSRQCKFNSDRKHYCIVRVNSITSDRISSEKKVRRMAPVEVCFRTENMVDKGEPSLQLCKQAREKEEEEEKEENNLTSENCEQPKAGNWKRPRIGSKVHPQARPPRPNTHVPVDGAQGLWSMQHLLALLATLALIAFNAPWVTSTSATAQEGGDMKDNKRVTTVYSGPSFEAFNCYLDKKPERLTMPSACKDRRGKPVYSKGTTMQKYRVTLYQLARTRKFTGKFCRVERSSSSMLCGTQDWTSVLSPPVIGDVEVLSGPACQQVWNTHQYTDTAYHKKFEVNVPGVTVYAYTARGTLQTSGQSIFCYGSTGRVLNGDEIKNSMVFLSYKVTLGTFEARRQVQAGETGGRDSVITNGPLAGVGFQEHEVNGGSAILGSVTLVMGSDYDDHTCPLSKIRGDLEMFVIPQPGKKSGELSTHPGDEVYALNRMTGWFSHQHKGTLPTRRQNYTLLVTGNQDLVLNLGNEYRLPEICGTQRFMETSHNQVLATLGDDKEEEDIKMLPLDLDLIEASSEYSARLDLLAFIIQVTLQEKRGGDICVGDQGQLSALLDRAADITEEGAYRLVPAGESIYRVFCPKVTMGAQWMDNNPGNCSEFLPVRKVKKGRLEGPQYFLTPNTRYLVRSPGKRQCSSMPSAYLGNDGFFYSWDQGRVAKLKVQPSREAELGNLIVSGLPDVTGRVAGGKELYTEEEESAVVSRFDFGIYLQGAATSDVLRTEQGVDLGGEVTDISGSNRPYVMLPGVTMTKQLIEHPVMSPLLWIYDKVGMPIWHLLLTIGSLCGMVGGACWLCEAISQCRDLTRLGAGLKGRTAATRGLDLIALSASSGARARRIREMEVLEAEGRILRAQAKARAFSLTSLQELPGRVLSTGSLQV